MLAAVALVGAVIAAPAALQAQEFSVAGRPVQVHGFASQAFTATDGNNFLTMETSGGSFGFADAGLNLSSQLNPKLRGGAQIYMRNVGKLGNWGLTVDWAYADYRATSWLGVRAGKVKTAIGLYNDTQDVDFLHTWALLPQAVYPVDTRSDTIAHTGVDLYGEVGLKSAGTMRYTAYYGARPHDLEDGFGYAQLTNGITFDQYAGSMWGADLRWSTPVEGFMVGASYINQDVHGTGIRVRRGVPAYYELKTPKDSTNVFYGEYQVGNLRLNGEYRRTWRVKWQTVGNNAFSSQDRRIGFASVAYRLSKWLEVGTYHSRFYHDFDDKEVAWDENHVFDTAATARIDISRVWTIKVEAHLMDGFGKTSSGRGFYTTDNPQGLKPETRMIVVRTAFNF